MRAQQGRSDDTGVTAVLIELTATCVRHHQAAIAALFRVVNRYVGNLAPMPCKQPWP